MSRFLENLNEPQTQAVLHNTGPMLVLAGPGSGKTTAITRRIARLIEEERVDPSRILGVTFTNKAAQEMKSRVEKLLNRKARGLWLTTFHAAAARILRKIIYKYPDCQRNYSFEIVDQKEQLKLMKVVIQQDLGLDDKDYKPAIVLSVLQGVKNSGEFPHEHSFEGRVNAGVYARAAKFYEQRLQTINSFDFGDLLLWLTYFFGIDKALRQEYSEQFQYILVDEFQDTNPVQLLLLDYLTCTHKNLCVVGDDFQMIYSWRNADVSTIIDFAKDHPGSVVVKLEQNYRSTPEIVEASNVLISHNELQVKKECFTENESGDQPQIAQHYTEKQEAWWVVDQVRYHASKKVPWSEIAVIYRTNSQSRILEESFVAKGIPYNIKGGFRFYDREEIQDLLSYLKVLANPANRLAWERILNKPTRGIGPAMVKTLVEYAERQKVTVKDAMGDAHYSFKGVSLQKVAAFAVLVDQFALSKERLLPSKLLQSIVDGLDFEHWIKGKGECTSEDVDRWNNVLELVRAVEMYEQETPAEEVSLTGFLERAALVTNEEDEEGRDKNKVLLTTGHSAKGLEFEVVFVTGLEEGVFPHVNSMHDPAELAEERRLFYVAITRAKRWLYLSHVGTRWMFGRPLTGGPSRFLRELT